MRPRSSNWEYDEKKTLLSLVKERVSIIESKCVEKSVLTKKHQAWREILEGFEALHGGRELQRLKEQWRRMKLQSKMSIKMLETYENNVGGVGPDPPRVVPTELDYEVQEILTNMIPIKSFKFDDICDQQGPLKLYVAEETEDTNKDSEEVLPSTSKIMDERLEEESTQTITTTGSIPETPWKNIRPRSSNWDYDEKQTLLALVKERISIVESKSTDKCMLAKKHQAWKEILEGFEALHGGRGLQRLKEQWRRMKVQSRVSMKILKNHEKSVGSVGPVPLDVHPSKLNWEEQDILATNVPLVNNLKFADNGKKQSPLKWYIVDTNKDSETVLPNTSNTMDEPLEGEPTQTITTTAFVPGTPCMSNTMVEQLAEEHTQTISTTAVVPETPPKRQRTAVKERSATGFGEILEMLKNRSAQAEEEREHIKRKREMEEELHDYHVEMCRKESQLLDIKLETKRIKLMYWRRRFEGS